MKRSREGTSLVVIQTNPSLVFQNHPSSNGNEKGRPGSEAAFLFVTLL